MLFYCTLPSLRLAPEVRILSIVSVFTVLSGGMKSPIPIEEILEMMDKLWEGCLSRNVSRKLGRRNLFVGGKM